MVHPRYRGFIRQSVGINYNGSGGNDKTDRLVPLKSFAAKRGLPEPMTVGGGAEANLFTYTENWIDIGGEDVPEVAIQGHRHVVDFFCNNVMPVLSSISINENGEIILSAH